VPEQQTSVFIPLLRSWHKTNVTSVRVAVPSMEKLILGRLGDKQKKWNKVAQNAL
jgi:hypothetical protein